MKKSSLKWVAAWAVLGGIVIGGAAVYAWTSLSDDSDDLNQATANQAAENVANLGTPPVAVDDRILLTPANVEKYSVDENGARKCKEDFASHDAEANETRKYANKEFGFTVELPYNVDWGTDLYRLNPFDERDEAIDDGTGEVLATVNFGQMGVGEGCGWYRTHVLSVREPRTLDEIRASMLQGVVNKPVTESNIPGLSQTAVEYDDGALCGKPTVEVLGEEFNLVIYSMCGGEPATDYPTLRSVAASLVLE